MIAEVANRKEQKKKDEETAKNKETLKSGGQVKSNKTKNPSKKKQLEPTIELEIDDPEVDEQLEKCKIIKHKLCKQRGIRLQVKWMDSSTSDWQYLYDMWADYPDEVAAYKKKNPKKCKGKVWKTPTIDGVDYFVRILEMFGDTEKVTDAQFIVLANNGYKFEGAGCVSYDELDTDDPLLLEEFLESLKHSPEADDVTIEADDFTMMSL